MIPLLLSLLLGLGDLQDAERAYHEGRFYEAARAYRAALADPDVPRGPVLYNLGNCAYRQGRFAEAILLYRRAKLRLADEPKVNANLELAERQLGRFRMTRPTVGARLSAWIDGVAPSRMLLLAILLQAAGLAGLLPLARRAARVTGAVLLVAGAATGLHLLYESVKPAPIAAVVLAGEVALRAEPNAELPAILTLPSGATVGVAEASDRWARVETDGIEGWTERTGLGFVR